MVPRKHTRGAALIIAVGILAILLALAVTFYQTSRTEMRLSTFNRDSAQAQYVGEAGLAIAQAFLKHDQLVHPTVTSIDHAWRTYFNGAWYVGKPWAWKDGRNPFNPGADLEYLREIGLLAAGDESEAGVPAVSREAVDFVAPTDATFDDVYIPRVQLGALPATRQELLNDTDAHLAAPGTEPLIYPFIPERYPEQFDPSYNPLNVPWANADERAEVLSGAAPAEMPEYYRYTYDEIVDMWADVDVDGDGLRDSMWIPIPIDVQFGEGPEVTDSAVNDGLDNDLDGEVDELGETAVFVYYENPAASGLVDRNPVLTAPLFPMRYIDENGDEQFYTQDTIQIVGTDLESGESETFTIDATVGDGRDNDYSLVVDDAHAHAFLGLVGPDGELHSSNDADVREMYHPIHESYLRDIDFGTTTIDGITYNRRLYLTSTGEPVCAVAGRVAVLVNDEASKANINTAHALAPYDPAPEYQPGSNARPILRRALNEGLGPEEYDLRVIPGLGAALGAHIAAFRTGVPNGIGFRVGDVGAAMEPRDGNWFNSDQPNQVAALNWDLNLPGYGWVDDNGNALWLATNGRDDDGDAVIYQYDGFDNDLDGEVDEPGEGALVGTDEGWVPYDYDGDGEVEFAPFEGIDEPAEYRAFRPYRNLVAENTDAMQDETGELRYVNEPGELGDRAFQTRAQLRLIENISPEAQAYNWRTYLTAHSTDENLRFRHYWGPDAFQGRTIDRVPLERPVVSGLKLDLNYAETPQIAEALQNDWAYIPYSYEDDPVFAADADEAEAARYLVGLRNEAITFVAGENKNFWGISGAYGGTGVGTGFSEFPADLQLRAWQLGANLQDNRDRDSSRITAQIDVDDDWWTEDVLQDALGLAEDSAAVEAGRDITYTVAGTENIRINEVMVRATRRVEAEAIRDAGAYTPPFMLTVLGGFFPTPAGQFDVNLFDSDRADGWHDFDVEWSPVPPGWIRGVEAGFDRSGNLYEVYDYDNPPGVLPANPWPGDLSGGVLRPGTAAIMPMGRFDSPGDYGNGSGLEDAPSPPHAGMESYIAFQAPGYDDQGVDGWTDYRIDPRSIRVDAAGNPFSRVRYEHDMPNLAVWRFGPSRQLPPGRYYLVVNTTTNGNADTATITTDNADNLKYLMKYGTEDEGILEDATSPRTMNGTDYAFVDFLDDGQGVRNPLPSPPFPATPPVLEAFDVIQTLNPDYVGTRRRPVSPVVNPQGFVDEPTGYVLLPAPDRDDFTGPADASAYGDRPEFEAGTVVIPPHTGDPATQEYLYVAIWKDPATGPDEDLAVNFFEFSQEPDHEYVELVNTGDEPVNVRGWTLTVGSKGDPNYDDDHLVMRIGDPVGAVGSEHADDAIWIAPGGNLLLTPNKYDIGAGAPDAVSLLYKNGIGMAASDIPGGPGAGPADRGLVPMFGIDYGLDPNDPYEMAEAVTVPAFPMPNPDDTGLGRNLPLFGSVFYRPVVGVDPVDFVDTDGDGILDSDPGQFESAQVAGAREAAWPSSYLDDVPLIFDFENGAVDDLFEDIVVEGVWRKVWVNAANKPWDRIVQLEAQQFEFLTGEEQMYDLVLRGGIFPNYPEEDYIDNDEDNDVLSFDGVDNNGDGFVDGRRYSGPIPERYAFLEYIPGNLINPDFDPDTDRVIEGMDEGRFRLAAQRAGAGILSGTSAVPFAGAYDDRPVPYLLGGDTDDDGLYEVMEPVVDRLYQGALADESPEWKNFAERRFFPGDAVIITLYEGGSGEERVVDRVTYTQLDVENASADDVLPCPYTNEDGSTAALRADFPSLWPANTMGVDFYRALERKHPLYSGDLAGTSNRWEATDGNYDDWDGGLGNVFLRGERAFGEEDLTDSYYPIPWDSGLVRNPPATGPLDPANSFPSYAHALHGSPLRRNFFHRAVAERYEGEIADDEDNDPEFFNNFVNPNQTYQEQSPAYATRLDVVGGAVVPPHWQLQEASVRNGAYGSIGDIASLNHLGLTRRVWTGDTGAARPLLRSENLDRVFVGRDADTDEPLRDLTALLATFNESRIELGAGQADFYPLMAQLERVSGDDLLGSFGDNFDPDAYLEATRWDSADQTYPAGWAPVFLMPLGELAGDTSVIGPMGVEVEHNFLLDGFADHPVGFTNIEEFERLLNDTDGDAPPRWPLAGRAMMYVAMNTGVSAQTSPPTYVLPDDPNAPAKMPAEALWTWDADDGVENGVYDVYVVTAGNLDALQRLVDVGATARMREAGEDARFNAVSFLDRLADEPMDSLGMTVEVFTDTDRNGRVWDDSVFPAVDTLDAGESYGRLQAVQPNTEGVVHYGRVKVENNYLAVFLRNWARDGAINRFSRVVLASRPRTPGRVNINTAVTDTAGPGNSYAAVNALMGAPGALAEFDFGDAVQARFGAKPNLESPERGTEVVRKWDDRAIAWNEDNGLAAFTVTENILRFRPPKLDGRYYDFVSEILTQDAYYSPDLTGDTLDHPLAYSYVVDGLGITGPVRDRFAEAGTLDSEQREWLFREKVERFARMANLLTQRSDVFEIIVLAQSGRLAGTDLTGDGFIDYRNDFIVSGERKIRTVYER